MSPEDVGLPSDDAPDEVAERVERVLLGRPASMRRREVSDDAGVEPVTARRFWDQHCSASHSATGRSLP